MPSPGSRRTGQCTHRIVRDRRLGRRHPARSAARRRRQGRRQAVVDAVGGRGRLPAASGGARQRRLRGRRARRQARRRARRACFGCGSARVPWRHRRRPCRRRARLVAQRRIGHRRRETAARRIRRGTRCRRPPARWSRRTRPHRPAAITTWRRRSRIHFQSPRPERHPPQPAAQSGKLTVADARSLLAYAPPKFPRGDHAPTGKVEVNMAKAGSLVV